ncbi:uncharacterized protein LOC111876763 isoform X6 [Lactuca sativa]|uniref:uncharacterized protein LOC111876763 isoform X6 n=1 Tax=Lactuca sativa TaxID=4236 RepID=UPI0022B06409|nr:uncharacterized protein LOC111876763 isoform X6 [Lactuca sativa]
MSKRSYHHMLWERQRRSFLPPIIFIFSAGGDPEIAKCFHFILQMSDARVLLSALHNFIRTLSKKLSHVLWERQKKFSFTNYIHIQSKWGSRNSKMLSFHTPDKEGILCHQLYSYSVQESRDEVAKSLELGFMMINKNGLLEGRFSM